MTREEEDSAVIRKALLPSVPTSDWSTRPVPPLEVYPAGRDTVEIDGVFHVSALEDVTRVIEEHGVVDYLEVVRKSAPLAGEDFAWSTGSHALHLFAAVDLYEDWEP